MQNTYNTTPCNMGGASILCTPEDPEDLLSMSKPTPEGLQAVTTDTAFHPQALCHRLVDMNQFVHM